MIEKLNPNIEPDVEEVYKLFNKYDYEVGFVMKPSLRTDKVLIYRVDNKIIGAVKFRVRRDKYVTLYEIVVDTDYRGKGYAKELILEVAKYGTIRLKCPVDNLSNDFYHKIGFNLIGREKGKKRALNVYQASYLTLVGATNYKPKGVTPDGAK